MYYLDNYENYIIAKGSSKATVDSYLSDIKDFQKYIENENTADNKVKQAQIKDYITYLDNQGKSAATIGRRLASLKSYYSYLLDIGAVKTNPCYGIKAPKASKPELVYLSIEEINTLLDLPKYDVAGKRDKALLEIMYATGLKAAEIAELKLSDINMSIGIVTVSSGSKARVVPMAKPCKNALIEYINNSRDSLLGSKRDNGLLFLNYLGEGLTRQGIWKILKNYAEQTDFSEKVSPQIIRNTFAAHLVMNGADIKSLQELLGHEDIMATKIYLSLYKNRIMDVYDRAFPRK